MDMAKCDFFVVRQRVEAAKTYQAVALKTVTDVKERRVFDVEGAGFHWSELVQHELVRAQKALDLAIEEFDKGGNPLPGEPAPKPQDICPKCGSRMMLVCQNGSCLAVRPLAALAPPAKGFPDEKTEQEARPFEDSSFEEKMNYMKMQVIRRDEMISDRDAELVRLNRELDDCPKDCHYLPPRKATPASAHRPTPDCDKYCTCHPGGRASHPCCICRPVPRSSLGTAIGDAIVDSAFADPKALQRVAQAIGTEITQLKARVQEFETYEDNKAELIAQGVDKLTKRVGAIEKRIEVLEGSYVQHNGQLLDLVSTVNKHSEMLVDIEKRVRHAHRQDPPARDEVQGAGRGRPPPTGAHHGTGQGARPPRRHPGEAAHRGGVHARPRPGGHRQAQLPDNGAREKAGATQEEGVTAMPYTRKAAAQLPATKAAMREGAMNCLSTSALDPIIEDLEALAAENRELRAQVDHLAAQLVTLEKRMGLRVEKLENRTLAEQLSDELKRQQGGG